MPRARAQRPADVQQEQALPVTLVAETPSPTSHERVSSLLAQALARETDVVRRAALDAIHTAMYDLQRRAASVDGHLRADYADILGRIEAL